MLPSMWKKIRIFCSDPDATDSSGDEGDQKHKKEKKLIGVVRIPLIKKKSSASCRVVPTDSSSDVADSSGDEDDQNHKKEKKLIGEVLNPLIEKKPSSSCSVVPTDSSSDVTGSSGDEDDQNHKKEKKLIGEVPIPLIKKKPSGRCRVVPTDDEDDQNPQKETKQPSSRFPGVRRRPSGNYETSIRNPLTGRREFSTHKTQKEAVAVYLEKRKKYNAEAMKAKAQRSVPDCTALSSSSSLSCKQEEQEARNGVGVSRETDTEATDESILTALPDQKAEAPISDILADKHSPRDDHCKLNEPPEYDFIGLPDLSHLPLPSDDYFYDLDSDPDWIFDLASLFSEPDDP